MNLTAADLSDETVLNVLEHNFWSLWARFGRGEGCRLHEREDALWFDTPISTLPYNAVLRSHLYHDVDQRIDEIFTHYKRRGVPFLWFVHPSAQPADLRERLQARGLKEVEVCRGMAIHLSDLPQPQSPPEGISIQEVTEGVEFFGLLKLIAWRWKLPEEVISLLPRVTRAFNVGATDNPVRCWVAWQHGEPVSKVVLHLASRGAGVYGVATKPEARGKGLATLLTLEALHAARTEGYELGVLHAMPMAQRMYERIGFSTREAFGIFGPAHATDY